MEPLILVCVWVCVCVCRGCFFILVTESHSVTQTASTNSRQSSCLSLPSAEITGRHAQHLSVCCVCASDSHVLTDLFLE